MPIPERSASPQVTSTPQPWFALWLLIHEIQDHRAHRAA